MALLQGTPDHCWWSSLQFKTIYTSLMLTTSTWSTSRMESTEICTRRSANMTASKSLYFDIRFVSSFGAALGYIRRVIWNRRRPTSSLPQDLLAIRRLPNGAEPPRKNRPRLWPRPPLDLPPFLGKNRRWVNSAAFASERLDRKTLHRSS